LVSGSRYEFRFDKIYKHDLFAGTIFLYFFLPETKGKSLLEIEDYFSGRIASLKTKKAHIVT
jgi:hypothetical protein